MTTPSLVESEAYNISEKELNFDVNKSQKKWLQIHFNWVSLYSFPLLLPQRQ